MDALPFCKMTLQRKRCPQGSHFRKMTGYPTSPKTIGEMIRKRRLDLKLRQIDVARQIGCDQLTIVNWERNHIHSPASITCPRKARSDEGGNGGSKWRSARIGKTRGKCSRSSSRT